MSMAQSFVIGTKISLRAKDSSMGQRFVNGTKICPCHKHLPMGQGLALETGLGQRDKYLFLH